MSTTCVVQESHEASRIALEALPQGQQSDGSAEDSPIEAFPVLEKWNQSRTNIQRTLATFWCFMVMGANDAAYGVRRLSTKCDEGDVLTVHRPSSHM
jgi:hypothetical protein